MTPTPRYSFVIPFFDCARFLGRAVDSVLAQQGAPFELLLLDDGSTDDWAERLDSSLADPRVRLIRQPNAGPAAARNHGAAEAHGEYVWFLDCDDELLPGALEQMELALAGQPDAQLLVAGHISRTRCGRERTHRPPPFAAEPADNFVRFLRKRLRSFSHGAVVVRRRVFERTRYPEALRNNEDLVFHAQVLALFPAASTPTPVVRIHARPDSLRHQLAAIDPSGEVVTDLLFDPAILPPGLLAYREEFRTTRRLSLFRSLCNAGRREQAKALYGEIVKANPQAALRWSYLRKYLRLLRR